MAENFNPDPPYTQNWCKPNKSTKQNSAIKAVKTWVTKPDGIINDQKTQGKLCKVK